MEVKKNYSGEIQNSELGPIPADWRAVRFEDVLSGFTSGATPYRGKPEYFKGNIRWITSGELNYNTITDTLEKITEEAVRNTNLKMLPVGTFLMAITGLEAAGTRGSCGIVGKESTTNQSCMALMPKNEEITTEYLYHFYVKYGNELAFRYCQGTKQQSYTGKIVKILPINLPPTLAEQRAIATALSDVDRLLSAYDQLIAKKKAIKQGAMQELLTGRRRLEGFEGEWKPKTLGQVAKFFSGGTPNTSIPEYYKGGPEIPWITSSDLNQGRITNVDGRITKLGLDNSSAQLVKNGTLLLALYGATAGVAAVSEIPAAINQAVLAIIPFDDNLEFLYQKFQLIREWLITTYTQGGQPNLSGQIIKSIELTFPTPAEQRAIAQILTDMDAEIAALEQQREKYKAVKAGMMQELLTGKTRLV